MVNQAMVNLLSNLQQQGVSAEAALFGGEGFDFGLIEPDPGPALFGQPSPADIQIEQTRLQIEAEERHREALREEREERMLEAELVSLRNRERNLDNQDAKLEPDDPKRLNVANQRIDIENQRQALLQGRRGAAQQAVTETPVIESFGPGTEFLPDLSVLPLIGGGTGQQTVADGAGLAQPTQRDIALREQEVAAGNIPAATPEEAALFQLAEEERVAPPFRVRPSLLSGLDRAAPIQLPGEVVAPTAPPAQQNPAVVTRIRERLKQDSPGKVRTDLIEAGLDPTIYEDILSG